MLNKYLIGIFRSCRVKEDGLFLDYPKIHITRNSQACSWKWDRNLLSFISHSPQNMLLPITNWILNQFIKQQPKSIYIPTYQTTNTNTNHLQEFIALSFKFHPHISGIQPDIQHHVDCETSQRMAIKVEWVPFSKVAASLNISVMIYISVSQ